MGLARGLDGCHAPLCPSAHPLASRPCYCPAMNKRLLSAGRPKVFPKRIGRLEYLTWQIVLVALYAVLMPMIKSSTSPSPVWLAEFTVLLVSLVIFIVWVIPSRMRDLGWPRRMPLLIFVPLVNFVVGLWLLFAEGTQGANRYGERTPTRILWWMLPSSNNA